MAIPVDVLTHATWHALQSGLRLLQGHRLADTDEGHVAKLLAFMDPEPGSHWLDVGCGFGEAARLMNLQRPDLRFTLLNSSGMQLDHCPPGYPLVYGRMEGLPIEAERFDGCMFLYSLCHASTPYDPLREAARVTRPGGSLFVYDYERLAGDNDLFSARLYAEAFPAEVMRRVAEATGWTITAWQNPPGDDALFRRLYADDAEYDRIFSELRPVLWKAERRPE
jgi:ubiquinone/menaquinone biosynthesis C-methylase UbiE